jgi:hypothetical protein
VNPERLQIVTNLRGKARRVRLMGREHIAVEATLVRSQVLKNNLGVTFLPAEDITPEWAEASNGSPAVADHPNVSARSPEVLNSLGVGMVFNARVEGAALRADVYLDPARVDDVPDLRAILAKLDAGQPVEVSTGFNVSIDETPGVHNGQAYDRVVHPTSGLDHLAVFAKDIGACSVKDGCGLAANHAGACETEEVVDDETRGKFAQAVDKLMALLGRVSPEDDDPAEGDDPAAEPTPEGDTMNREQMIAQLAEAGPLDKDALNKLSDCQLKALSGAAPGSTEPTDGDSVAWQKAREWREKFESLDAETKNARQAEEQEKGKLLDDLLYNARALPWSETEIRAMDIVMLRKVHKTAFPQRADFAGRGGPAGTGTGSFDFVKGIMDGPAGSSVLDRKEAN